MKPLKLTNTELEIIKVQQIKLDRIRRHIGFARNQREHDNFFRQINRTERFIRHIKRNGYCRGIGR